MKKSSHSTTFIKDFLKNQGLPCEDFTISGLAGDGSKRLFMRVELKDINSSFIFMENSPQNDFLKKENLAYLKIGNHMRDKNIPLPKIYKYDLSKGYFILEDMGDNTLQDEVQGNNKRIMIYENVIEILLKLQLEGTNGFDVAWCCQTPVYDSSLMRKYEAWYFRDSFLKDYVKADIDFSILDESFEHIISMAGKAEKSYLLHRDFQSRNIMCNNKGISILDWQGARLGPLAYDVAALLFDPYVNLPTEERDHLIEVYASLLKAKNINSYESFKKYFPYIAVMRILQALGAYSFLSMNQGKKQFKQYIPIALKSLKSLLDEIPDPKLSPLINIVNNLK